MLYEILHMLIIYKHIFSFHINETLKIYFSLFFSVQVFENAIDPGAVSDLLESRCSHK